MNVETLKVRNTVYNAIDNFFRMNKYYEIAPPILTPFTCEVACVGGSDLISVDYYNKTAYLSQSGQLYLEALAMKLEKVYCISPTFRAESTLLSKHLTEFWMCESELLFVKLDELIQIVNDLLISVIKTVIENNTLELEKLGTNIIKFEEIISGQIPRVHYSDAIEILKKEHISIEWGDDIEAFHEEKLCHYFDNHPLFITNYPVSLSAFYKKKCINNPDLTMSFDVVAPNGFREIIGGSIRNNNIYDLRDTLSLANVDTSKFDWYLDLIESNPVEHGGYGLGIERLISWICNLNTIEEAIPFPRTEDILWP